MARTEVLKHDNGNKCKIIRINNHGALHGIQEGWHRSGKRYYTVEYKNGERHGQSVYFGKEGGTMSIDNFVEGELDGVSEFFDDDVIISKERYVKGSLSTRTVFHSNGNLARMERYEGEFLHGESVSYCNDGIVMKVDYYVKGKEVGYGGWIEHNNKKQQLERDKDPLVVALRPLTDAFDYYLDHNVDRLVKFIRENKDEFASALEDIDVDVRCPSCGDDFHIQLTKCKSDGQT